jgi:hypothetical protein
LIRLLNWLESRPWWVWAAIVAALAALIWFGLPLLHIEQLFRDSP